MLTPYQSDNPEKRSEAVRLLPTELEGRLNYTPSTALKTSDIMKETPTLFSYDRVRLIKIISPYTECTLKPNYN